MAQYTFTAANVSVPNSTPQRGIAGEALAIGSLLYLKASDSKLYLADNNVTAAEAACVGIAVTGAEAGQPVGYVQSGEVTVQGAAFAAAGKPLYLSTIAGKCGDIADAATGHFFTLIGWTTAVNKFRLNIQASGLAIPA